VSDLLTFLAGKNKNYAGSEKPLPTLFKEKGPLGTDKFVSRLPLLKALHF